MKRANNSNIFSEIPTHMVLMDRRTGKPVGPAATINPKDWPYSSIPDREVLWRYMSFEKFKDLLEKSAIYFARGDRFQDPFEGRYTTANNTCISPTESALRATYPIKWNLAEMKAAHEVHRRCTFISCWHRNSREDRAMWNAYTKNSESVVITTSAKALRRFVPENIMKFAVKYHDPEFPRTDFGWNALFFYKPASYSLEREFRMLRNLGEEESVSEKDPKDFGRHVQIRLKKIIHRVITHPEAKVEFKIKAEELMKRHLKKIEREDSVLL